MVKRRTKEEKLKKKQELEEEEVEEEEIEEEPEKESSQEENESNSEEAEKKKKEEEEEDKEKSEEELAPIDAMNMDMGEMNIRIQKIAEILSDFKAKRDPNKSRNDYIIELKNLLMQYYDYNEEIANLIMNIFPPNEAIEFMEANNTQKVLTIRTNTLKTKRRELAKNLIQRGVNLDPLAEWTKVGLKIYSSTVPIGATPEYLAGHYMLQSASSFLPVLALDPQPNEKILDMCASPGGKTTYIAQLMKNTGILVANDMKKERIKSLFFNIHRLGIKNSIITNYDARKFPKFFNSFDRVLLDAPCSGLGVIAKDQSVKVNRTYKEVLNNSRVQKELILAAIDSVNVKGSSGGIVVYSTCSISVEENEWVVDYALRNRYVKCIEVGFEVGEPGMSSFREKRFHPSLKNTRRIYPHVHNMDGFFVAKLKKYADGPKGKGRDEDEEDIPEEILEEFDEEDADEDDGILDDDYDDDDEFESQKPKKKNKKDKKKDKEKGKDKVKDKEKDKAKDKIKNKEKEKDKEENKEEEIELEEKKEEKPKNKGKKKGEKKKKKEDGEENEEKESEEKVEQKKKKKKESKKKVGLPPELVDEEMAEKIEKNKEKKGSSRNTEKNPQKLLNKKRIHYQ